MSVQSFSLDPKLVSGPARVIARRQKVLRRPQGGDSRPGFGRVLFHWFRPKGFFVVGDSLAGNNSSLKDQLEKIKPQLTPVTVSIESNIDKMNMATAQGISSQQQQQQQQPQQGDISSDPPMATLTIGATRANVPLTDPERNVMVKNIITLQEQTIRRERQAWWASLGHLALTLLAVIGLGAAMYKGVKSEVQDFDPRGRRGPHP